MRVRVRIFPLLILWQRGIVREGLVSCGGDNNDQEEGTKTEQKPDTGREGREGRVRGRKPLQTLGPRTDGNSRE